MSVIRTFISKVKPGRMQDAVAQLSGLKRVFLESGASHFGAYSILTGPIFPGLTIHAVFDDFATWGAARERVSQHPEGGVRALGADAPTEIVRALLAEPVHRAGDVASIIEQTKVRFTLIVQPHRGRADDAVRRGSRLADTIKQCGALAAVLRRIIAGIDGPRMTLHSYFAGYAELEATRNAVLESDVWTALQRSQDEVVTRMGNIISERLVV